MKKLILSLIAIFVLPILSGCATTDTAATTTANATANTKAHTTANTATNGTSGDAFATYHNQPQQSNAMENAHKMISY